MLVTAPEDFAAKSCENGSVDAWFSGCDPAIRGVSRSVNGPALAAVAEAVSYEDMGAVEFFRSGIARRSQPAIARPDLQGWCSVVGAAASFMQWDLHCAAASGVCL